MFLEKQLKEEKVARNQAEKERVELEVSWVQTNIKFETFKANFDNCQERVDMSSRVQKELKSRIKKHVILESELAS